MKVEKLSQFIDGHTQFATWLQSCGLDAFYKQDSNLILCALTHTSFSHENKDWPISDNERLEFLGDAILDAYISRRLYCDFANFSEGELSRLRSSIVNESTLADWACVLKIDEQVLLGKGEKRKDHVQQAICADAFEAIIGACSLINFDQTFLLLDNWCDQYDKDHDDRLGLFSPMRLELFDPKTKLQEKCLELYKVVPSYESQFVEESQFKSTVRVESTVMASALGPSKKKAERQAATICLLEEKYKNLSVFKN